jgi:hypothetical protein
MVSVFAWWWSEQSRLRFFRKTAGAVCLVAFAGQTFSVKPTLSKESKSSWTNGNSCCGICKGRLLRFIVGSAFKQGLCRLENSCGISGAGLGCWKRQ